MKLNFAKLAMALSIACSIPTGAHASSVTWTFNDVTFQDGSTLSGQFVYDADVPNYNSSLGEILSGTATTATGTFGPGATYTFLDNPIFGTSNTFYASDYYPGNIDSSIGIFLDSLPTDAGGTIGISYAFERKDNNTNGQQNIFFRGTTSSNGYISSQAITATPEPSVLFLMTGGLATLAVARRRRP